MAKSVTRKSFEWPREFSEELSARRIDWNLEDPERVRSQAGVTSENVFVIAMLRLALEALDQPRGSERLWDLAQEVTSATRSRQL